MKTRDMLFKLNYLTIVSSIFLIALILLSISCKKDDTIAVELKIGLAYQGGIIFNLDATGKHGLIAATIDQSSTDTWWNGTFVTTGATNTTNGFANTTKIINAQGNNGIYAARLCTNYRGGDYSDWFLPSKEQLNILYINKSVVGAFSDNIYWSSTEYDLGEAWVQDFSTGEQHLDNISDGANVHTRAVRAF